MELPIKQTRAAILAAIDDFLALSDIQKENPQYIELAKRITSILDEYSHTGDGFEIHSMLTLSTAHIDQKTRNKLMLTAKGERVGSIELPVYDRNGHGWFIPVDNRIPRGSTQSLVTCIATALTAGCDWLCIDEDGPVIANIPTYK